MSKPETKTKKTKDLLIQYRKDIDSHPTKAKLIEVKTCQPLLNGFSEDIRDPDSIDHYNPGKVFNFRGKKLIPIRSEPNDREIGSCVNFCQLDRFGNCRFYGSLPILINHQDPFYCGKIENKDIFGAVSTDVQDGQIKSWRTVFYSLNKKSNSLTGPIAKSAKKMKGVRLIEIKPGRIGVFTRPQEGKFGRGEIGYLEISSLDELEYAISNKGRAKIIKNVFSKDEWGGYQRPSSLAEWKYRDYWAYCSFKSIGWQKILLCGSRSL